jgi:ABC-type transport system involved in multi-copper enzyme maturation permease subunit
MYTLIKFELKKILQRRIFLILILVFTAFAVYNFVGTTLRYTIYDSNLNRLTGIAAIRYDRDLQNQYAGQYAGAEAVEMWEQMSAVVENPKYRSGEGTLTDEAYWKHFRQYETVWNGLSRQNDIENFIIPEIKSKGLINIYAISGARFFQFTDNWTPLLAATGPYSEKLLTMYENLEQPLMIEYNTGFENLIKSLESILLFPVTAILIISLAPVFSDEYGAKTAPVLLTTKHGKRRLIKSKIIAAYLFAIGLFLLTSLLYMGFYLSAWGVSGAGTSIRTIETFGFSPYDITAWQALLSILGMSFLGFLFITSVTLLVSAKAKNAYNALIPLAAIVFLPLIDISRISVAIGKILLLFPINTVVAVDMFRFPIFYNMGGISFDRIVLSAIVSAVAMVPLCAMASKAFRTYQVGN